MSNQITEITGTEHMPEDELAMWQVEMLRLTAFPTAIPDISSINWWEKVTGESPETRTVQPRTGRLHEVGRIKGDFCNLSLECQPQRIDWLFTPIIAENQELTSFPSFASLSDALRLYEELLFLWLDQCPSVNRLAFGAMLSQTVENREAGYLRLTSFLPAVTLDAERSTDFSYQINRPRASRNVKGLEVNRLSRWSVAALSGMMIQVTGEQVSARVIESSQKLSACRLELDINTSPQFKGALSNDTLPTLVKELVH